ncbi:MAG: hypothetical protein AB7T06_24705 [Kofleriaceae bacterium]
MSNALDDVTEQTLDAIKKAQTTGILVDTGITSYDLSGIVSLIPVVTPLRDKIAREQSSDGNAFATWRAYMDVTNQQPRATMGFDYAANEVIYYEQDFQARYKPVGLAGLVTQDSLDLAKGYADTYAQASFQTLNQVLIAEDKLLFGGQSFVLPRPAAPTLVQSASGGSIGTTTVYVAVAARTGSGYYYGGNSRGNSANSVFASGSTNKLTASVAAVKGAVAYDWFQSANGSTWYYYSTTTVANVVMTAVIGANQPVGNVLTLPDLASWLPTVNLAADNGSAPLGADSNPTEFDGLFASITGDYNASGQLVTAGTATANGATWIDLAGAALTLNGGTVTELDTLFAYLWGKVKCSPTAIMMNAVTAQKIAYLILGSASATTFLNTDASGRINVTAGGRVGQVINTPAGGVEVPIEVHVSIPPGTIVARTDRVPFPQAGISNTLAVRTLRDMTQFDYAAARVAGTKGGGPRKEFEIRSVEAFVNRAPVAMGAIVNIG